MGALTEIDIMDCLAENFRTAAECCDGLAKSPFKGPTYNKLRNALRLIEGACRQASAWREDTRWLPIGRLVAEAHQKAGGWLRGYKEPITGRRVKFADGEQNQLFVMLAANMRALHKVAEGIRSKATGRVGMILPKAIPGPYRDTKPVGWSPRVSTGGIIIPDGVAVA